MINPTEVFRFCWHLTLTLTFSAVFLYSTTLTRTWLDQPMLLISMPAASTGRSDRSLMTVERSIELSSLNATCYGSVFRSYHKTTIMSPGEKAKITTKFALAYWPIAFQWCSLPLYDSLPAADCVESACVVPIFTFLFLFKLPLKYLCNNNNALQAGGAASVASARRWPGALSAICVLSGGGRDSWSLWSD